MEDLAVMLVMELVVVAELKLNLDQMFGVIAQIPLAGVIAQVPLAGVIAQTPLAGVIEHCSFSSCLGGC